MEGEELFNVSVCSTKWVERICKESGYLFGRHYLIVPYFDFTKIEWTLRKSVESVIGKDWHELSTKVGRIGKSEFEDYRPYDPAKSESAPTR